MAPDVLLHPVESAGSAWPRRRSTGYCHRARAVVGACSRNWWQGLAACRRARLRRLTMAATRANVRLRAGQFVNSFSEGIVSTGGTPEDRSKRPEDQEEQVEQHAADGDAGWTLPPYAPPPSFDVPADPDPTATDPGVAETTGGSAAAPPSPPPAPPPPRRGKGGFWGPAAAPPPGSLRHVRPPAGRLRSVPPPAGCLRPAGA